jgi:uncharacterized SAM-binding protein YcdF (DUF218 family)
MGRKEAPDFQDRQACWTARTSVCDPTPVVGWLARILFLGGLAYVLGLAWFVGMPVGRASDDLRTDAIVVLTGDEGRIARGLALLRAGAAPRLLISGVAPGVSQRQLARKAGVPFAVFRCCVDLGHEAIDTRSNAEETARWAAAHKISSLRLVTSDYHMRRATMELRSELGPDVRIVSDAVPTRLPLVVWAREYAKWLVRSTVRRAEGA